MLKAILANLTGDKKGSAKDNGRLNLIPGFDANTGNYRNTNASAKPSAYR
jgi:nitrogenase molybdenum-iron protein beta chain